MTKTPEQRYQSASGIRYDLLTCQNILLSHPPPSTPLSNIPPTPVSLDLTHQFEEMSKTFIPGHRDRSKVFTISEKIYGRDHLVKTLVDCYDQVVSKKIPCKVVFIVGDAGTGKTKFINELYKPVLESKGFFGTDKKFSFLFFPPYYFHFNIWLLFYSSVF